MRCGLIFAKVQRTVSLQPARGGSTTTTSG
nr:MAG TPA: hypothetical protein [Caudoviricetes sp.]